MQILSDKNKGEGGRRTGRDPPDAFRIKGFIWNPETYGDNHDFYTRFEFWTVLDACHIRKCDVGRGAVIVHRYPHPIFFLFPGVWNPANLLLSSTTLFGLPYSFYSLSQKRGRTFFFSEYLCVLCTLIFPQKLYHNHKMFNNFWTKIDLCLRN